MKKNTGTHSVLSRGLHWLLCVGFGLMTLMAEAAVGESGSRPAVEKVATEVAVTPSAETTPATPVAAAHKPVLPVANTTSTTAQLANLIGGLALILVLIYGLSWFVKRFTQGGFMQNSAIRIIASLPLGTRERLMLVEIGGKQILLGITAAQINSLHVFTEPVLPSSDTAAASPTSDFSQKLMAILQQKNSGKTDSSEHNNIK